MGFPAADGLSSGAGEGALSAVGELDGDGVLGDVDGHDGVGVAAAQREFLPGDQDDPGGRWPALHGDWLHRGAGWWASGAGTAQFAGLVVGQWVGSGAQQLAGVGIKEHQGGGFDADADAAAAEDLCGEQPVGTQRDQAAAGDGAVDFQGGAGLGWGQWRGASGAGAGGSQVG